MSATCSHCGAQLAEGQRFCAACGAQHSESPGPAQKFCISCGSPMPPGGAFCNKCGAHAAPGTSPPLVSATSPGPAAQQAAPSVPLPAAPANAAAVNPPVPAVAASKSGGCGTILIVVLVLVVLAVGAGIGGVIYVGYRVKKKAHELASEWRGGPDGHDGSGLHGLGGILGNAATTPADLSDVAGSFKAGSQLVAACPEAAPTTASDSDHAAAKVPLREGLSWVNAWRRFNGDVEIMYKITATAPNYVDSSNSGIGFVDSRAVEGKEVDTRRQVCRADLQSASTYITENDAAYPSIIPHTTAFSLSQSSLQQLKTNGKITINYEGYLHAAGNRIVPVLQTAEMTRVEPSDVNYPVILNGQPTTLPVIHARGRFHFSGDERVKKLYRDPSFLDEDGEIFVVDDAHDPFMLLWKMGPVFQVRVVSITFPVDQPKPQIEEQLAKQKKAVIYGIYFDFNQATIKKESQPVLKEIADALKNNPDWVLAVHGYTDNIGGDAYNLDLSKRRAASVKSALVQEFGVSPERLTTEGSGSSNPVDSNDTLEGRARNRRVELVRP
ncbi:MAG: OmpA family protein [Terriglobales bacterium]